MNLLLIFEKKFNIDRQTLLNFFDKSKLENINVTINEEYVELQDGFISKPFLFNDVPNINSYDRVLYFTNKQYEDNYFFHTDNNIVICSFYAWKYFTNLSKSNGVIYFLIDVLALEILPSSIDRENHKIKGCIYNFLWDKIDIDEGMREAKFCNQCLEELNKNKNSSLQNDLKKLMNILSKSSQLNEDILFENEEKVEDKTFSASDISITNETIVISKLIKKLKRNKIDLYENEKLWDKTEMSRFIESILLRLPLPALYFDVSRPESWQIIDGVNRLVSLKHFIIDNDFKLTNLEFLKKLNGKDYLALDGAYKRIIDETAMITYQVEVQTPKAIRDSIFNRINGKRGIQ